MCPSLDTVGMLQHYPRDGRLYSYLHANGDLPDMMGGTINKQAQHQTRTDLIFAVGWPFELLPTFTLLLAGNG